MKYKKVICGLMMAAITAGSFAQSGTNSPYSQYGFGVLNDQATGFNKGTNGLGQAVRNGSRVNPLNPASFSAIDSFNIWSSGVVANMPPCHGGDREFDPRLDRH